MDSQQVKVTSMSMVSHPRIEMRTLETTQKATPQMAMTEMMQVMQFGYLQLQGLEMV